MHFSTIAVAALLSATSSMAQTLVDREFPHLIIPVKEDSPSQAFGTQYSGEVKVSGGGHRIYTEVLFDVPSNAATTCAIEFNIAPGNTAPWSLTGTAPLTFNISTLYPNLVMDANRDAWDEATRPAVGETVGTVTLNFDGSVQVSGGSTACAGGQVAQFILHPANEANDIDFTWFEETNPLHGISYAMYQ